MYYQVCYDISSNKTRLLAVKLCKKAGLVRVQRSVFLGASLPALIQELKDLLLPLLNSKSDSLTVQPLDPPSYRRLFSAGMPMNKTEIAREQKVIIL